VALPLTAPPPEPAVPTGSPPVDPASRTVLVVDDEPSARDVAIRMLNRRGYRTLSAEDGNEALAILADPAQRVDLVLLDLVMPHRDGVSTLRELRKAGIAAPVVIVSGYSAETLPVDLDQAAFLQKPYRMEALLEAIGSALGAASSAR